MSENRADPSWAGNDVVNVHQNAVLKNRKFHVVSPFDISGDQGQAIDRLAKGIEDGDRAQTLKGVTGSGKTFTMAKIIERINRPTLVLSHNKTLAAQLYREFKSFFPDNAVEYFVSTYDYYQPEAYVPGKDLYIEKEADINDEIDRLRLSASFSLMERRDVIVISTVSCIYGLGNPVSIKDMIHTFSVGEVFDHKTELEQLVRMLYERNDVVLSRGTFRVRGDIIEIYPAYLESAVRITLDWDEIVSIEVFDPLTLEKLDRLDSFTLYPAKQFVMPKEALDSAIGRIESELEDQLQYFESQGKLPVGSLRHSEVLGHHGLGGRSDSFYGGYYRRDGERCLHDRSYLLDRAFEGVEVIRGGLHRGRDVVLALDYDFGLSCHEVSL